MPARVVYKGQEVLFYNVCSSSAQHERREGALRDCEDGVPIPLTVRIGTESPM